MQSELDRKGFTLVELLVVIGILAVLATAVVVVLNPAELLKQARDAQRLSDLSSINSALALYVASTSSPTFGTTALTSLGSAGATSTCDSQTGVAGDDYTTDGLGWVAVNLSQLSGGSPLPTLPRDPTNNTTYKYCYDGTASTTWELMAALESEKFGTAQNLDGNDGGDCATCYEIGTDLTIL